MAVLGTENQTVWLSPESLGEDLQKHPVVGLQEYRLLPEIIDKVEVYRLSEERPIEFSREGKLYRVALKTTMARDQNYLLSLFATSDQATDAEVVRKYEWIR